MPETSAADTGRLRIGSLFSGYGGLDLAVEEVFDAKTIWFSEVNEPVARIFGRHWPDAPNLGDITTIDWTTAPPADILCGGFPRQSVSTGAYGHRDRRTATGVGGTRGRPRAAHHPCQRPVRGEGHDEQRNPENATDTDATPRDVEPDPSSLGDGAARPLTAAAAVVGDLVDLGYDTQWIGLPASVIGAPHPRFRVFLLARRATPNAARVRRGQGRGKLATSPSQAGNDRLVSPDHRPRPPRADRLSTTTGTGRLMGPDRGAIRRSGRYADAIVRWEHITARPAPAAALLTYGRGPRPAPRFVEWLTGLPEGWVTDPEHGLTDAQQLAALGNGVLPAQASAALSVLSGCY